MKTLFLITSLIFTGVIVKADCQQDVFYQVNSIPALLSQLSQCNPDAANRYNAAIYQSQAYRNIANDPTETWYADCNNYYRFFQDYIYRIKQSIANCN